MPSISRLRAATALLLASVVVAGTVQAQPNPDGSRPSARALASATATSNMPSGSGEASTMTNGVPNLLASNPQQGELGIQSRLTVRPAVTATARYSSDLSVMGGAPSASSSFDPLQSALHHRSRD